MPSPPIDPVFRPHRRQGTRVVRTVRPRNPAAPWEGAPDLLDLLEDKGYVRRIARNGREMWFMPDDEGKLRPTKNPMKGGPASFLPESYRGASPPRRTPLSPTFRTSYPEGIRGGDQLDFSDLYDEGATRRIAEASDPDRFYDRQRVRMGADELENQQMWRGERTQTGPVDEDVLGELVQDERNRRAGDLRVQRAQQRQARYLGDVGGMMDELGEARVEGRRLAELEAKWAERPAAARAARRVGQAGAVGGKAVGRVALAGAKVAGRGLVRSLPVVGAAVDAYEGYRWARWAGEGNESMRALKGMAPGILGASLDEDLAMYAAERERNVLRDVARMAEAATGRGGVVELDRIVRAQRGSQLRDLGVRDTQEKVGIMSRSLPL